MFMFGITIMHLIEAMLQHWQICHFVIASLYNCEILTLYREFSRLRVLIIVPHILTTYIMYIVQVTYKCIS